MSAVFAFNALTSVVYSSVQTAIHVRPVEQIVSWSESQHTVYAHLPYGKHNTKVKVKVHKSIPAYITMNTTATESQ